mmetsp:Transcript_27794/g.33810  ORF Transcript_27794/g.33810 Transcript_27794/m.33810 type:complete len:92 (-) Transcript_27794:7-282(-)
MDETSRRRFSLKIIGSGPLIQSYIVYATFLLGGALPEDSIGIDFVGAKTYGSEEFVTALRDIDVLVYPSLMEEAFCIAKVEAMASGIPIVR